MDWEKMEGQPYSYFTYAACYCEVELDCLTGDYRVRMVAYIHLSIHLYYT